MFARFDDPCEDRCQSSFLNCHAPVDGFSAASASDSRHSSNKVLYIFPPSPSIHIFAKQYEAAVWVAKPGK